MKKLAVILALVFTGACGGWEYKARPEDGGQTKTDHPNCVVVELHDTNWWGRTEYTPEGRFCKVTTTTVGVNHA